MSLTSYRAAPSRATNKTTSLSPRSLFCLPFRFRDTAAGCSIPLYQQINVKTTVDQKEKRRPPSNERQRSAFLKCEWVFPVLYIKAPAAMPGDALLFQRLSGSTIGAIRFHGRVRDGIGWVTDAMVTKQ
jgi:hypothetical protein